jgi:lysophospholipase
MMDDRPTFFDTPGNPAPDRLSGGYVATPNGRRLRYAIARPKGPSRGTVLLLPGRNECAEKYFETMGDLTARAFTVLTFDWRGQGGSDRLLKNPQKGHVSRLDHYYADFEIIFRNVALPDCPGPYVILAHSLGALVALRYMPRLANRIERIVCSAPLIGLPARGSAIGMVAAAMRWTGMGRLSLRRLKRLGPDWNIATNPLTSDPARFQRNRALVETAPHLSVNALTAGWLHAAFRAMRRLENADFIAGLHVPTLIVTAGADRVVDTAAAERLAWRMRSGHLLSIPHARHELLQERDEFRAPFLAAFEGFVESCMPMPDKSGVLPEPAV